MSYAFEPHESVADGVRRIIGEQIDEALDALRSGIEGDAPDAVHEFRKRCKKIRAIARLVRPALGDGYDLINALARDAALELSALREASALSETLDRLVSIGAIRGSDDALRRVCEVLVGREGTGAHLSPDLPEIERVRRLLTRLAAVVDDLELDAEGWDAIGPGLHATYRRGRRSMREAIDEPTAEHFHEWRKSAKYTRHHLELLIPTAPDVLEPLEDAFHDLTGALGDGHDLHVLADRLEADRAATNPELDPRDLRAALDAVNGAAAELQARAIVLGRERYAERPKRFTGRLAGYWSAWHEPTGR